jgi:hypothetical protein
MELKNESLLLTALSMGGGISIVCILFSQAQETL